MVLSGVSLAPVFLYEEEKLLGSVLQMENVVIPKCSMVVGPSFGQHSGVGWREHYTLGYHTHETSKRIYLKYSVALLKIYCLNVLLY